MFNNSKLQRIVNRIGIKHDTNVRNLGVPELKYDQSINAESSLLFD